MLETGKLINQRYKIVQRIGRGGMGAVYQAIDTHLNTTVALKHMTVDGEKVTRIFAHEARLLANLKHPALTRVTDHFICDVGPCLVMEYVQGSDLGSMLEDRETPFPLQTVVPWVEQLLDVLEYLHNRTPPIVHHDLKPQNLKLTQDGRIILLDFGLARGAVEYQTQLVDMEGVIGYTRGFAPPEQVYGKETDQRSDLYALGATIYALLTRAAPESAEARVSERALTKPDPLRPAHEVHPDVPVAVSKFLMQAMALVPDKRLADVAQMRSMFRAAIKKSTPVPPWRRFLPVAGIGAVLLIGLLFAAGLVPGRDSVAEQDPTPVNVISSASADSDETVAFASTETSVAANDQQYTATAIPMTPTWTMTPIPSSTPQPATPTPEINLTQTAIAQVTTTAAANEVLFQANRSLRASSHLGNTLGMSSSAYDPALETGLFANGYTANLISLDGIRVLQPSQSEPINHTWVRDLDYAAAGYSYVLGDMQLFRDNLELFLADVEANGIVPDVYNSNGYGLNQAWDAMPNLIAATYYYVSKTGDFDFYRRYRQQLNWVGGWITDLDTDGDGLPDRNAYPFGYYNSIRNGSHHTYALAKFYAAYRHLAELEQAIDNDGTRWMAQAETLRSAFNQPYAQGGYWLEDQAWPLAWRSEEDPPAGTLESFGVFEAIRSGLIAPDNTRYAALMQALHEQMPALTAGDTGVRLALNEATGGYPEGLLRPEAREAWKNDASAPWIVGIAAPAYARAGYPADAQTLMNSYANRLDRADPMVPQLVAVQNGSTEGDGGAWASAAWFLAVYQGHYGITMTPQHLIIQPAPFKNLANDQIRNLSYQGARLRLTLDSDQRSYRITTDRLTRVLLRPMAGAATLRLNDGPAVPEITLLLEPDQEYVIVSDDAW